MKTLFTLLLALLCISAHAGPITVASYNIKFLSVEVQNQGDRLSKLKSVIAQLNADVIGLQEIKDRAALELLFPPDEWTIVIDDASGDDQDVAVVARKSALNVKSHKYLFEGPENDTFFPNRRDLLCVDLEIKENHQEFSLMVHHAKARVGGRASTDARREGAARKIVEKIKSSFEDKFFVILGDFNDNPDDRSLNILETGNSSAVGGPEEIDGPLMINLMDRLCAEGHVSHGRSASDIVGDRIDTIDPQSRNRNNLARNSNQNTGDILFDQILFPVWMQEKYVTGSVKVFDGAIAVRGTSTTAASDHLPVSAEFDFDVAIPEPMATGGLEIVALLPNPDGPDEGNEEVTLGNFSSNAIDLSKYALKDRGNNRYPLSGSIPAQGRLVVRLTSNTMPLNNTGDDVAIIISANETTVHSVSYAAGDARSGHRIEFR